MNRVVMVGSICLAIVLLATPSMAQPAGYTPLFVDGQEGARGPFPMAEPDGSLAQSFEVSTGLAGVSFNSPSWSNPGSGYTFKLYAWDTDYATTVAGELLATKVIVDYVDNSWPFMDLDPVLPPGQYLAVTDTPVSADGQAGHWGWNDSNLAADPIPAAFQDGALVAGRLYAFAVAEGTYVEPPAEGAPVWTFDCGSAGLVSNGKIALTSNVGSVTAVPTGPDPFFEVPGAIDGSLYQEFAMQMNVANAPGTDFPAAFFWFANGGHGRAPFNVPGDGDLTVRFNIPATKSSGAANWDATVNKVRLDLPDGDATAAINAGTMFTIDWMAITDDAAFEPAAGDAAAVDCDADGLSSGYEAALGTDPFVADSDGDGVNDGMEVQYGTDPLDFDDAPTVPVSSGLGLAAIALALALAGLTLVRRRRTA